MLDLITEREWEAKEGEHAIMKKPQIQSRWFMDL
jgi:hypothetical protein